MGEVINSVVTTEIYTQINQPNELYSLKKINDFHFDFAVDRVIKLLLLIMGFDESINFALQFPYSVTINIQQLVKLPFEFNLKFELDLYRIKKNYL